MHTPTRLALAMLGVVMAGAPTLSAQDAKPAAATPSATTPPNRDALVAQLDSIARNYLEEAPATGMSVAVVSHGDTLLLKGYGDRDRERHLAADVATVYRVGSITKQFTAAEVMRLVEKKKVRLDDPITKYLPQYPQWSAVTIRELLNHTSGIHSYTENAEWRKHWSEDLTPDSLVGFIAKDTLDFKPGTKWHYDNSGYMLLGMLLEKVNKQPYAAQLERDFFKPLGMRTAAYCPSKPTDARYAIGYSREEGTFKEATYLSMTHPYAAGALCMSVSDFLRWQSALMRGKIVSPTSLALMTGPESLSSGAKTGYGMGLAPGKVGNHVTVQHGGSINGFSTQQYWFPAESLSVVVFVSSEATNPDGLANNLASAVLGLPVLPYKPPTVPLTAADRAKYEGTYEIVTPDGNTMVVKLFSEGDTMMGQPEGQGKTPLRYIGDDTFGADFDASLRLRFKVDGGRAVGGTLEQRGASMPVKRRP